MFVESNVGLLLLLLLFFLLSVESNVGLLLLLYVLIKNSDIFCCQSTEALLLCVESNVDMLLLYVRKQCFCFYFLRYGRFFLKYLNLKNNSL